MLDGMICDLCQREKDSLVRVNSWVVCSGCSSDDTLKSALKTAQEIERLRDVIVKLETKSQEGQRLKKQAQERVDIITAELRLAVDVVVRLTETAGNDSINAEHARVELSEYAATHPLITPKRRHSE